MDQSNNGNFIHSLHLFAECALKEKREEKSENRVSKRERERERERENCIQSLITSARFAFSFLFDSTLSTLPVSSFAEQ